MLQLRHLIGSYYYYYNLAQQCTEGTLENDYFYILYCGDIHAVLLNNKLHIDTAFCKCLIRVINVTVPPSRLTRRNALNDKQNTFIHLAYLNKLLYKLYNGIHNFYDNNCGMRPLYNKFEIQKIVTRFINNPLNDDPFGFNNCVLQTHIINSSGETKPIWAGSTYKTPFDVLKTNIHVIQNSSPRVQLNQLYAELYALI